MSGPFRYRDYGQLAVLGRSAAVADLGWLRLKGIPAWMLWSAVHLVLLMGARNKVLVYVNWVWAWLTYGSGARLMTGVGRAGKGEARRAVEKADAGEDGRPGRSFDEAGALARHLPRFISMPRSLPPAALLHQAVDHVSRHQLLGRDAQGGHLVAFHRRTGRRPEPVVRHLRRHRRDRAKQHVGDGRPFSGRTGLVSTTKISAPNTTRMMPLSTAGAQASRLTRLDQGGGLAARARAVGGIRLQQGQLRRPLRLGGAIRLGLLLRDDGQKLHPQLRDSLRVARQHRLRRLGVAGAGDRLDGLSHLPGGLFPGGARTATCRCPGRYRARGRRYRPPRRRQVRRWRRPQRPWLRWSMLR